MSWSWRGPPGGVGAPGCWVVALERRDGCQGAGREEMLRPPQAESSMTCRWAAGVWLVVSREKRRVSGCRSERDASSTSGGLEHDMAVATGSAGGRLERRVTQCAAGKRCFASLEHDIVWCSTMTCGGARRILNGRRRIAEDPRGGRILYNMIIRLSEALITWKQRSPPPSCPVRFRTS